MPYTKIVQPGSWDFSQPITVPVPATRRGLTGHDARSLVKQAGDAFVAAFKQADIRGDETPVRVIALGAGERWSANRRGDYFSSRECRERHGTFVKHAKWYRDHQNQATKHASAGRVVSSVFNEDMRRVELLCALYNTKAAADRDPDGHGVVADRELQLLAKGQDPPVSMACLIDHDTCMACGNEARARSELCDGPACKYGGCKKNLARTFDDGFTLGVDNHRCTWFDISHVPRQADRTAYCARFENEKTSEDPRVRSGAELAESLGVVAPPLTDTRPLAAKLASLLADGEAARLPPGGPAGWTDAQVAWLGDPRAASIKLAALTDHGVLIPAPVFARWLGQPDQAAALTAAAPALFRVYGKTASDRFQTPVTGPWDRETDASAVVLPPGLAAGSLFERPTAVSGTADGLTAAPDAENTAKTADFVDPELARDYAGYQLAQAPRLLSRSPWEAGLTLRRLLAQNRG